MAAELLSLCSFHSYYLVGCLFSVKLEVIRPEPLQWCLLRFVGPHTPSILHIFLNSCAFTGVCIRTA